MEKNKTNQNATQVDTLNSNNTEKEIVQELNQNIKKSSKVSLRNVFSYGTAAFGHDVFFGIYFGWFSVFLTSQVFANPDTKDFNNRMIAILSAIMVIIRIGELFFDPIIGNIIDNTKTRWGKFKPWIFMGRGFCALSMIFIFSQFTIIARKSPVLFLVTFTVIYIVTDILFSFADTSLWGMTPALSETSQDRAKMSTVIKVGALAGGAITEIIFTPCVKFFSNNKGGDEVIGDPRGWFIFVLIAGIVVFATAAIGCIGMKEVDMVIRQTKKAKIKLGEALKSMLSNDQLMWVAAAFLFIVIATNFTSGLWRYYFIYILGRPNEYVLLATINLFATVSAALVFPFCANYFTRKKLGIACIIVILLSYILLVTTETNLAIIFIAYVLMSFPGTILAMVILMFITDSIEYGQLKTGVRQEANTLVVRPLIDKMGMAVSTGIVGFTAIVCSMTSGATAETVHQVGSNVVKFKIIMLVIPFFLKMVGGAIFIFKVKLTEKYHSEIVQKLKEKAELENK